MGILSLSHYDVAVTPVVFTVDLGLGAAYSLTGVLPALPLSLNQMGTVPDTFTRQLGKYYELKDHLGNVRVVVSDRLSTEISGGEIINFSPDFISYTGYYPFGMKMPGRSLNAGDYRYGFNGMEKDQSGEFGGLTYTTEFRQYDPRIGRWLSLDPMMSRFADQSPYNFVFNQPINSVDINGDCPNGDCGEEEVVAANEIVSKHFDPNMNQKDLSGVLAAGSEYLVNRFGEDATVEEAGFEAFNNLMMNIWSDMKVADALNPVRAATYAELINEAGTLEEKADLIEMRGMWVHNDVAVLQIMALGLQALLSAYPGTIAARGRRVSARGFSYTPRGFTSNIGKIHKNSNNYVGHQGVYEIRKDGQLLKYGKADMTKLSSTGNPIRLQSQINALRRLYPRSTITGKVLYSNPKISTANIKKVETRYIQNYYNTHKAYPPRNLNHPSIVK